MHEPTKEMRESMATMHEKMAACLRSDRPVSECRKEMMQSCHDMIGEKGCGMGMMDHGRKHDHLMPAPRDSAAKP